MPYIVRFAAPLHADPPTIGDHHGAAARELFLQAVDELIGLLTREPRRGEPVQGTEYWTHQIILAGDRGAVHIDCLYQIDESRKVVTLVEYLPTYSKLLRP